MTAPLIQLANVDVALEGATILRGITWRLRPGEHWAILGGNGSGKSTFLKLIRGELAPAPGRGGRRIYAFDGDVQTTAVGIKEKIALVSPELQARYLQQEWRLTGREVVHSGFFGGDYVYQRPARLQLATAEGIIRLLGIGELLPRNVQELSTGELRKILIARALAGSPRVLVCDEVCDGLDAPSRNGLLQALDRVARNGTQLLYTTHRAEELVPAITHRLVLERGRIMETGECPRHATTAPGVMRQTPATAAASRVAAQRTISTDTPILIQIDRANVFLGGRRVLHGIELKIERGQHWAILGANGSGKSTLLKLIVGDLHPALGGHVRRFDFTPKNTLWELRRKIGSVSPELQANYRVSMTGADVIASGFSSSIGLVRGIRREQRRRVAWLIDALGLRELAAKNVLEMSYGEMRRALLGRALVHEPELLVCDEPFDGLDAGAREELSRILEQVGRAGTTLVMVTHHAEDLPSCTTHVAELRSGRLSFCGRADDFFQRDGACRPGA